MKTLIAEDELTSRRILQRFLESYGPSDIAVTGKEAVEAVREALEAKRPYDLVCLDIMMPEMNGQEALKAIRRLEETTGIAGPDRAKIIMTTAHADASSVMNAREEQCDYFLVKPVQKAKLLEELRKLGLIH